MVGPWQLLLKKAVKILYIPVAFGIVFSVIGAIVVANRDAQYTARSLLISFSGNNLSLMTPNNSTDFLGSPVIVIFLREIFWSKSVLDIALADLASEGIPVDGDKLAASINIEGLSALNTFSVSVVSPDPYFAVSSVNAYSDAFALKMNSLLGWDVIKVIDYCDTAYPAGVNNPLYIILAFAFLGVCLSLTVVLAYSLHGNRVIVKEDILSAAPVSTLIIIPRHDIK